MISKVKCLKKYDEVWIDIKLLFWFGKDQIWVEIKQLMDFSSIKYRRIKCGSDIQMYKHNVPENLGLQISGISRQQTLSMLVSIGAQHSHLHQVLLPILPSTSFVAALLLLARSLRLPAISNWNLWFCGFKRVWLQA